MSKDLTLYFYSNTNTLRSCLAHGSILCNACLGEHVHQRTLGNYSESTLFLTHLRLKPGISRIGLEEASNLYPVILAIRLLKDSGLSLPAHLLSVEGKLEQGDLMLYDPKHHVGAFVLGELPLSLVEAFLFEAKKDRDAFYDPSPNLWFPETLYRLAGKEFKETLDIQLVTESGLTLDKQLHSQDSEAMWLKVVQSREKLKAVALMCMETACSLVGEEQVNIDALTLRLLGLDRSEVLLPLPQRIRNNLELHLTPDDEDILSVLNEEDVINSREENHRLNGRIFSVCYHYLLEGKRAFKPDSSKVLQLIDNIYNQISPEEKLSESAKKLPATLEAARRFFTGAIDVSFRTTLGDVPRDLPAFTGMLMVLKSGYERRLDHFVGEMDSFGLRRGQKRCAWLLYAALNGLNDFNGQMKSNLWRNRLCEAYALGKTEHDGLISQIYSVEQYNSFLPKAAKLPRSNKTGYPVLARPQVEPEELRNLLTLALKNEKNQQIIFEILSQQLRPKATLEPLTKVEYQFWKEHVIGLDDPNSDVIRSSQPAVEIRTLDSEKFRREWLAEGSVFDIKYKTTKERKLLLAIYRELTGDQ